MNRARRIAVAISLALLILGLVGSFTTRGVMEHLPFLHGRRRAGAMWLSHMELWTSGPGRQRRL